MKIDTYRFRAECEADVENLKMHLPGYYEITREVLKVDGTEVPTTDVTVILTTTKSLQEFTKRMKSVTEGHVMAETIQFVTEYSGIRNRRPGDF